MEKFILDSSMALSWLFEDEFTDHTDSIRLSLGIQRAAIVPSIWLLGSYVRIVRDCLSQFQ